MQKSTPSNYRFAFILVTSLFFFWGFLHNLDPVLIAKLRSAFSLSTFQASLVDSSVFIAYFIMAIPAGIIMKKYGYKFGIILGLLLFGIGCFLFIPAANTMQYSFFLGALFIVSCGLTILETAANPYATILGSPETATQRLNFAQSFNGLASFLAPIIGGRMILADNPKTEEELNAMGEVAKKAYLLSETGTVKLPYIILGSIILIVALVFYFTNLPDKKETEEEGQKQSFFASFKYNHLRWAVVAQFFYVGAQVCINSFLILIVAKALHISDKDASWYSGAAGLAFLIGRFAGTGLMQFVKPPKLLSIYALINILLCLAVIFSTGFTAIAAIIAIVFFSSIMFPTIFALGIKDLGSHTKPASSFIIMAIVGGALLPPVFGIIADKTQNLQLGYIVPLICFAVVGYFGWRGHKIVNPATNPSL